MASIDTPTERQTWGFLVAIEDEIPVTKAQVEYALQDSFALSKVDVGELGVIDCYDETGTAKGSNGRTT